MMYCSPWDEDVTWNRRVITAASELVLVLAYVKRAVLRVVDDGLNDDKIMGDIRAATEAAEEFMDRTLAPTTLALVMDRFPYGGIRLPRSSPLISIVSFDYVDENGADQSLAVSPADYTLVEGGPISPSWLYPLPDASWPSTRYQQNAVTITYQAGYATNAEIPPRFLTGIELMVAELYKQRSMSVSGTSTIPATIQPERFWTRVI